MLKIEDFADWLEARLTAPGPPGPAREVRWNIMPDEGPAEMVVVNVIPGLQSEIEDALDNPVVKVRSRGATSTAASDLAHTADRAVMDAPTPFFLNGVRVLARGRLGGPPWSIGVDRLERTHYECNYWFTVVR